MDSLLALIALVVGVLLLGLPIVVAWLMARVGRLERELAGLRTALGRVERRTDAPHGEPVRAPELPAQPKSAEAPAPLIPPAYRSSSRPAPALADWVERPTDTPAQPAAPESRAPRARIEWERWLGVRGAGVLGGLFAALAAVLLFRHGIQEGWITPGLRVGLGLVAGLGLGAAGLWLRPRGYRYAPDALIGAGAVAHYASLWAAAQLFELVPGWVAFGGMALVTAVACWLALRANSVLVALVSLAGGFATPLLLATGEDRPFGLFGYLLLLDLGLLFAGRRLGSSLIAGAALACTALLQGLWIGNHHAPGREPFTLAMLAAFALVFVLRPGAPREHREGGAVRLGGLLLPFAFAFHVGVEGGLEVQLGPLLGFAAVLLGAGCLLGARGAGPSFPTGAVAGALALLASWRLGRPVGAGEAWSYFLGAQLVALIPHVGLWLAVRRARASGDAAAERDPDLAPAATLAVIGVGALLLFAALSPAAAPFAALVVGLGLLWSQALARAALGLGTGALALVGLFAGASLAAQLHFQAERHAPGTLLAAAMPVALVLLGHLGAFWTRGTHGARAALLAVGLAALFVVVSHSELAPLGQLVAATRLFAVGVLTLAALLAAWRRDDPLLLAGALLASAVALALPGDAIPEAARAAVARPWGALASLLITGLVLGAAFALAPLRRGAEVPARGWIWIAGLAPLVLALALERPMHGLGWYRGEPWLPAAFALVAWACAMRVGRRVAEARSAHGSAAIVLGALALARGIDVVPDLVAAGLVALGAALLWRRTFHPAVKLLAVGAALVAAGVCAAHFAQRGYYPRTGTVLLNGLAFAHLVAAAGASLVAGLLARDESSHLGAWERRALGARPLGAPLAGLAAALLWFLWLTLTVMELWSDGPRVRFPEPRVASFDLTLSLSWAAYGLALLALGLLRSQPGPRWASLAVLLLAIGKVFLRDLGDLEGLARVGSLAGLALSLTLVSLLYQRFVFGRAQPDPG